MERLIAEQLEGFVSKTDSGKSLGECRLERELANHSASEEQWRRLLADLRHESSIAHTAYHLGAIRQILAVVKNA